MPATLISISISAAISYFYWGKNFFVIRIQFLCTAEGEGNFNLYEDITLLTNKKQYNRTESALKKSSIFG